MVSDVVGGHRLLVLGAGRHQTALIRRAEARGVTVVASDYYPNAPGKAFATHPVDVDALDVDANLAVADQYGVTGVITIGTDMAVRTMARIAEQLGLPCYLSADAGVVATDKVRMSQAFAHHGVSRPRHVETAGDLTEAKALRLPVVVKPADSQGQRGTTMVREAADLETSVAGAIKESRTRRAVVEEFVEGFEVTASAWVEGGQARLLLVADRVTYNPPPAIGIAFQHISPSLHAQGRIDEIRHQVDLIARAYGMTDGPLYVQMIVARHGVFIIEAGGRVGGGHEASLIPVLTGVDVIDRLIDLATTGACEPLGFDLDAGAAQPHGLVNFLLARPGTVAAIGGFDALLGGLVEEGGFYVQPGHVQSRIVDSLGRVGYFVASDTDRSALLAKARAAYALLAMTAADGEEMLFWPEQYVNG